MVRKASMRERLVAKLNPRAVKVSPKFHAILACMLGEEGWTTPGLAGVVVTSDGFLLARREGDCGHNDFLGTKEELDDNLRGVAKAVGLTKDETAYLMSLSPKFELGG